MKKKKKYCTGDSMVTRWCNHFGVVKLSQIPNKETQGFC